MCLTLSQSNSRKPHNSQFVRWKVCRLANRDESGRFVHAFYQGVYRRNIYFKADGWNVAQTKGLDRTRAGFHVFVNLADAELTAKTENAVVKPILVRGFLRSGTWDSQNLQSETWKQFRFIN